jgi:lipoyl-dependent peroxiredoxin subunit D
VLERPTLTPRQLWGTLLVSAIASRSPRVLHEVGPQARELLSPEAYRAARATAASVGMNNVFFRTRHLLSDPVYGTLRAGLRASLGHAAGPVDRVDVELWSLAVSAVNACADCLDAHERALRRAGAAPETIQEAFRVASVIQAVAVELEATEVLGD